MLTTAEPAPGCAASQQVLSSDATHAFATAASPFVDPETKRKTQKKDANVFDDDAFRPRRERVVDAKAPAAKGGFFRWRALIEGKAGR